MLTGFPSRENAIEAVNNSADAFFVKPIDLECLFSKINELLKKQEKEQAYDEEKMVNFIETKAKMASKNRKTKK